jgi:pyrroline-5-carboxylate reductase
MPNTPLLAGLGMSAIAPGSGARDDDVAWAMKILGAAGQVVVVAESLMDAVTAVSGSGPAYVYYLAEAMTHAATELGMGEAQARRFVNQTVLGAATLLDQAEALRRQVMSPGGTTEAAIDHLEGHQVGRLVADAVRRAADRSAELGA